MEAKEEAKEAVERAPAKRHRARAPAPPPPAAPTITDWRPLPSGQWQRDRRAMRRGRPRLQRPPKADALRAAELSAPLRYPMGAGAVVGALLSVAPPVVDLLVRVLPLPSAVPGAAAGAAALESKDDGSSGGGRMLPAWMRAGEAEVLPAREDTPAAPRKRGRPPKPKPPAAPELPQLQFPGAVEYIGTPDECDQAVAALYALRPAAVGFDIEWRVLYVKGAAQRPAAVLQLCVPERCWVIHTSRMGLRESVRALLRDEAVAKVGVNIRGDLLKLQRDFALDTWGGAVDLSRLANARLGFADRWSLAALVAHVLERELPKPSDTRCGNWEQVPLLPEQLFYAALDAFAGLQVYRELLGREPPGVVLPSG